MTTHGTRWSPVLVALSLLVLCVFGIALGSAVGSTGFESWLAAMHDDIAWQIVWDIRLPRSAGACAAGALLGLAGALAHRKVARVLVTHYHPDHIGLAGWFQAQGAELVTTRVSWLYARMLVLDEQATPSPEAQLFEARAGVPAALLKDEFPACRRWASPSVRW